MARSMVIFEGKKYINAELYKAAFKVGDAGVSAAAAQGIVKPRKLFDNLIYAVNEEQAGQCADCDVKVYDVDEAMRNLEVLLDDTGLRSFTVPKSKLSGVIRYAGFQFIRFADIRDKQKNPAKHRLPMIRICGSMYVALNTKNKAVKRPIIVTVSDKATAD